MTSSPVGNGWVLRMLPVSFLNLMLIFELPWDEVDFDDRGIVSTLVEADTSVGVEISFGFRRLRTEPIPGPRLLAPRPMLGDLFSATMAALALRWTSISNFWRSVSSTGLRVKEGDCPFCEVGENAAFELPF